MTKMSEAAIRRIHASDRAAVIDALGMVPEGVSDGDKYPATTGEMAQWLREKGVSVEQTWHPGPRGEFVRLSIGIVTK